MGDSPLDAVDRQILHLLQENARSNTATEMAKHLDVSANTVRNRIEQLEESNIIRGYNVDIDYGRAGLSLHYVFICSARISERDGLIDKAQEIDGVVEIRELMTGTHNVHIEVVGTDNEDITRIAKDVDSLGLEITDEVLIRRVVDSPLRHFSDEDDGSRD